MIKVLQIGMVNTLGGGIQTFLMNYYNNIDRKKIQFDFVNIYNDGEFYYKKQIENLGGKVYNLSNYYRHPIRYIKELINLINENKYEIIHCNMNSAVMLYPLIASKLSKAKIIISHSHNSSSDKGVIKSVLHNINKHFIPLFANYYFACSNVAGEWFYSKKILKSDKYFVIKNAIDTTKFKDIKLDVNEYKSKLGINEHDKVLLHVGRFTKQKNQRYLINLFKKYHKKHKNSTLLLVGEGEYLEDIKKENKDDNSIKFLGQRTDINKIMKLSDIFILPSLYEGLPLVGIEAQYCGLPCIFSDQITKELTISESIAYMPLNDSKESWIDMIDKLIDKKNKIIDDSYDISIEAKRLEKLYKDLLKR